MSESPQSALAPLYSRLDLLMLRDRQRFQRRLQGAKKIKNPAALQALTDELSAEIAQAEQRVASTLR